MPYELILFDADGTLFDYDQAEAHALTEAFRSFGVGDLTEHHVALYRKINAQLWREFELNRIATGELRFKRFRMLFDELGLDFDVAEFSRVYLSFLAEGAFLIEGAEEVVEELSRHYKLAMITNGIKHVQISRMGKSPLAPYFPEVIISEEVGYPKPHRQIFEHAFSRLGHTAKETAIIIGDSLSSDIQGGITFGIDTCWYNPSGQENREAIKPKYEVRALHQIKEVLLAG